MPMDHLYKKGIHHYESKIWEEIGGGDYALDPKAYISQSRKLIEQWKKGEISTTDIQNIKSIMNKKSLTALEAENLKIAKNIVDGVVYFKGENPSFIESIREISILHEEMELLKEEEKIITKLEKDVLRIKGYENKVSFLHKRINNFKDKGFSLPVINNLNNLVKSYETKSTSSVSNEP